MQQNNKNQSDSVSNRAAWSWVQFCFWFVFYPIRSVNQRHDYHTATPPMVVGLRGKREAGGQRFNEFPDQSAWVHQSLMSTLGGGGGTTTTNNNIPPTHNANQMSRQTLPFSHILSLLFARSPLLLSRFLTPPKKKGQYEKKKMSYGQKDGKNTKIKNINQNGPLQNEWKLIEGWAFQNIAVRVMLPNPGAFGETSGKNKSKWAIIFS